MTVGTLAPNERDLYKIVNIVRQLAEGRSNLISAYIATLLSAADRAAALTALGISGYIQTLLNAADAAAARVTLGLADTGFSTGDAKITLKTTADPGWLIMNDGTIDLVVIEVQRGAYTGEDDIFRYADEYGRAATLPA